MYITFDDLLGFEEMKDAKVLAGNAGLIHLIKWGHVIELKEAKDWAASNMLVFTTGVAIQDDTENGLMEMIESLSETNASGLVLGLGIIKKVPKTVLKYADEKDFPFITVPREVSFAEIIYKIGNRIFEKMSSINRQHILIENVLTDTSQNNYEAELEYYGYLRGINYCLVAIRKSGTGRIENAIAESLQLEVQKIRNIIHRKIFYYHKRSQLFFLIPETKGTDCEIGFESILHEIDKFAEKNLGKDLYHIAVSEWVDNPSRLSSMYKQIITTFEKGKVMFPKKKVIYYKDLGIFSVVDFNNTEEIENIMRMSIGELYLHPDLIETLQFYINCNMNMQETADEMYLHVNTVKYRMKKIDQLLPEGLEKNRLYRIQTGIYLAQILSKEEAIV